MKIYLLQKQPIQSGSTNRDQLYSLFLELANAGLPVSVIELINAMGFRSPAPLMTCISNLERDGQIRIAQT